MRFDHYRLSVKTAQRTCQIIDNDIFIFLELRYLLRSLCLSDTCTSVLFFSLSVTPGGKGSPFFAEFIKYRRERCLARRFLCHLAPILHSHWPFCFFISTLSPMDSLWDQMSLKSLAEERCPGIWRKGVSGKKVRITVKVGSPAACGSMALELGKCAWTVKV